MTHDPLCPLRPPMNPCDTCALIARVREDEASKNIGTVSLGELAKAQEHTYNAGYAAALRDAVEAVKASHRVRDCEYCCAAAIEALGETK